MTLSIDGNATWFEIRVTPGHLVDHALLALIRDDSLPAAEKARLVRILDLKVNYDRNSLYLFGNVERMIASERSEAIAALLQRKGMRVDPADLERIQGYAGAEPGSVVVSLVRDAADDGPHSAV